MKASTTILSGIILVVLGAVLTMTPGLFAVVLSLPFAVTAETVPSITLVDVVTGNVGLLIGFSMIFMGVIYILALPLLSYSASLDIKVLTASTFFIATSLLIGYFSQDFPEYDLAKPLSITIILSILLVLVAPFVNMILPGILKKRREFEDAKISADKLFAYAASHNRNLQKLQDKIDDLENQEEILKNLMGEEKVEAVFKIIDRRERNNRIGTFIYGIVTGVISTYISSLLF